MPYEIKKLTPNLIVSSVEQSLAFYCDVLGFTKTDTVPEQSPYVFAIVQSGPVTDFLNAPGPAVEEYPAFAGKAIGGTLTLYMEVSDVEKIYERFERAREDYDAAGEEILRRHRVRVRRSGWVCNYVR